MRFAQIRDRVEFDSQAVAAGSIDTSGLLGTWINSNPDTSGIVKMVMSASAGILSLRTYAIGPDGLIDWGSKEVDVFASAPSGRAGAGFTCRYDFGFAESLLQGMIMKGLLVLAQLHRFKDDSKRADYFVREYYALTHEKFR
jgi:hypothetical protein